MSELVVFCGLQASGKSTFYRERFAATHVCVSKDAWPNARNKERRQRQLIADALRAGRPVVVDNTNPTPADRAPLIAIACELGVPAISYAFITTVDEARARNATRAGRARVPDAGIFTVAKRLSLPTADEPFTHRFEVRLTPAGFEVIALSG